MWYEVDTASEDVGGFVEPFRVHRGVETLDVAPPGLFVGLVVVALVVANYVVCLEHMLNGLCNGCLCLPLWQVVGH